MNKLREIINKTAAKIPYIGNTLTAEVTSNDLKTLGTFAFFTVQSMLYGCGAAQTDVNKEEKGKSLYEQAHLLYSYDPTCESEVCNQAEKFVDSVESRLGDDVQVTRKCVPNNEDDCQYAPLNTNIMILPVATWANDLNFGETTPQLFFARIGGNTNGLIVQGFPDKRVVSYANKVVCEEINMPSNCLD